MSNEKSKFNKVSYNNAYNSVAYDRINLTVPKGEKEKIKAHAEGQGKSVNSFINEAINEKMERER